LTLDEALHSTVIYLLLHQDSYCQHYQSFGQTPRSGLANLREYNQLIDHQGYHFIKSCKTAPLELRESLREASCSYFSEIFPKGSVSTTHRPSKIIEHFRVVTDAFIEKVDMKV
jgi:hypothetical protein